MIIYKAIIRRRVDGYLCDPADGIYKLGSTIAGTKRFSATEDANVSGFHTITISDSLPAWDDGFYDVIVYEADSMDSVGSQEMRISVDTEVSDTDSILSLIITLAVIAGGNMSRPYVALQRRIITSGSGVRYPQATEMLMTMHVDDSWTLTALQKIYLCIKKNPSDDNADAILNRLCTFVDAQTVTLTPTEAETNIAPGDYIAEIEVRDAADANPQKAMQFIFTIIPGVRHYPA